MNLQSAKRVLISELTSNQVFRQEWKDKLAECVGQAEVNYKYIHPEKSYLNKEDKDLIYQNGAELFIDILKN